MNEGTRFLTSIAQAISAMNLYEEGHPARERMLDAACECLRDLQEVTPLAQFNFLGDEIVMDKRPVDALKNWDWGSRSPENGAQVSRDEGFLGPTTPLRSAEARQGRTSVRSTPCSRPRASREWSCLGRSRGTTWRRF